MLIVIQRQLSSDLHQLDDLPSSDTWQLLACHVVSTPQGLVWVGTYQLASSKNQPHPRRKWKTLSPEEHRQMVYDTLREVHGNINAASRAIGVTPITMRAWMRRYGISVETRPILTESPTNPNNEHDEH